MSAPLDPIAALNEECRWQKPKFRIYQTAGSCEKRFVGQCFLGDDVIMLLRLPGAESIKAAKYELALRALRLLSEQPLASQRVGKSYDVSRDDELVELKWPAVDENLMRVCD